MCNQHNKILKAFDIHIDTRNGRKAVFCWVCCRWGDFGSGQSAVLYELLRLYGRCELIIVMVLKGVIGEILTIFRQAIAWFKRT